MHVGRFYLLSLVNSSNFTVDRNVETVTEFSLESLTTNLLEDLKKRRRVVVLLSSSPNYSFGKTQRYFFHGNKMATKDVFFVRLCVYVCG